MENPFRSIVLLDKPAGPTSLECSEAVRRIFSAKKAGHAGTLDPGATGVLIIALDEATKAMHVLMRLEKEYEGVMHIHRGFSQSELGKAVKAFKGKITQRPPVRSAVSRVPREREICSFRILRTSGRDVSFRVRCQAGTYIRKLCSDIGEWMGTQAHMKSLRRTKAGNFSIRECATPEQIKSSPEKFLVPIEKALERTGTKRIFIKPEHAQKILNGSPVLSEHIQKADSGICKGDYIGIFSGQRMIALGKSDGKRVNTDRIIF